GRVVVPRDAAAAVPRHDRFRPGRAVAAVLGECRATRESQTIVRSSRMGSSGRLGCLQPGGAFSLDGRAGHFLRDNRAEGRLLVYFDWGEYVLWHMGPRLKVSIDGRRETVYSAQTIAQHQTFYKAEPGARAYLEELDPDLVWLPRKVAVSKLIGDWGWHPVFESDQSAIWTRNPEARTWRQAQLEEPSRCFPGP